MEYDWIDKSKLVHYKKLTTIYLLIPIIIVFPVLFLLFGFIVESFTYFGTNTYISLFVLGFATVFILGPWMSLRYKSKRDLYGHRIAFKDGKVMLVSEMDGTVKHTFENPIIYIDHASYACYIANPAQESIIDEIFSKYDDKNSQIMVRGDLFNRFRPVSQTSEAVAASSYATAAFTAMNLFYRLKEIVPAARLIDVIELQKYIDSLQKFKKETRYNKYYKIPLFTKYKI